MAKNPRRLYDNARVSLQNAQVNLVLLRDTVHREFGKLSDEVEALLEEMQDIKSAVDALCED